MLKLQHISVRVLRNIPQYTYMYFVVTHTVVYITEGSLPNHTAFASLLQ